jgi:type I phosphodiesterase/nucleotide pyrophosphatase
MVDLACGLPPRWIRRMARGYHPGRSAEIQLLPKEPNFVGSGLPHVGPWDYTTAVPMFWYGPGFIEQVGVLEQHATVADIAPTWARLLDVGMPTPEGRSLTDVLVPADRRRGTPRLLVTLIWDGAGNDVLEEWPDDWPNLRSLIPQGAWIGAANVGSSPTSTAQIHATIGTGVFPRVHGVVGHALRIDGRIEAPWTTGPDVMLRPTLADRYAEATDRRSVTGMLASVPIHLGMLGKGAAWRGNDKPPVVLRAAADAETLGAEGPAWNLPELLQQWYRFPPYANRLPALATYFDEVDGRDGTADGLWEGAGLDDEVLEGGVESPAVIPYQTRLVEEFIAREGFGADGVPDLLYLNYKVIDMVGHIWSLNSPQMRDTIRMQDEHLAVLIDILNRDVGEGRWAMVMTSDHGSTPDPKVSGAFQISSGKLAQAINDTFRTDDGPVVELLKRTEIFLHEDRLAKSQATLADVAGFVMTLTQDDLSSAGLSVPDPRAPAFEAAFPSEVIPTLPCDAE